MIRLCAKASLVLLSLTLAACTSPPSQDTPEGRSATVRSVLWTIAKYRDRQPHDNPAVAQLDPRWGEAYVSAEDPESRRVAMVKLLDQLDDGHAGIHRRADTDYFYPSCVIGTIDGRQYVEWFDAGRDADGRWRTARSVVEVHTIDGYGPNRLAALATLLFSAREEPARLVGRRVGSGEVEEFLLNRTIDGSISVASTRVPSPTGARVTSRMVGAEDEIYAAILRDSPSIGLVRYAWMSRTHRADDDSDAACQHLQGACDVAEAMIAAADAVSDCDWIIVDLQGSAGGTCAHAAAICATLLPKSVFTMPFSHLDRGLIGNLLGSHHWKWPRRSRVGEHTRFLFLIDDATVSASEHIAGVFRILPDTVFIGTRSAGSEYSLGTIDLADGLTIDFGANPGVWRGLPAVEGRGISPTIHVPPDEAILARDGIRACMRDHRRRSLEAAIAFIDTLPADDAGR